MNRNALLAAGVVVSACMLASPFLVSAQSAAQFPAKPIRIIVGFAPGGATDLTARLVAQKLTERISFPLIFGRRS